ncbi:TPA-induced transmembrane protein homolog isoform X2 [Lepisosteus oculatus]|uniref:TPA-induced transmembrane protein homolog isoform X2 n=1 Tax=Lepisosteus oculatus TaxID=7918 RepID=UPI00371AE728
MSDELIEMDKVEPRGSSDSLHLKHRATSGNGTQGNTESDDATEISPLVQDGISQIEQGGARNGDQFSSETTGIEAIETITSEDGSLQNEQKRRSWRQLLDKPVFWKCKLWMVILLVFIVLATTFALSLVLYSVVYEDEDEKFNLESFVVPLCYNGTLRLVNNTFEDSEQHQALSRVLEEKLSGLYSSSPALGRYFSNVTIHNFSNNSVSTSYWLRFMVPQEHNQLVRYTLSEEVVLNIFRQYVYDQEPEVEERLKIDPLSLTLKASEVCFPRTGSVLSLQNNNPGNSEGQ